MNDDEVLDEEFDMTPIINKLKKRNKNPAKHGGELLFSQGMKETLQSYDILQNAKY